MERRFGSWAIPHLGLYLVLIQGLGFLLLKGGYAHGGDDLFLAGEMLLKHQQWWRLLSFLMLPSDMGFFLLLQMYIFYLISSSLEREWGTFRFNLFILCGYLLTVAMAFLSPLSIITNTYFLGAVFLAFATLFPHFEFLIFFVLPVKVKWLGWLTAASFALVLFTSPSLGERLCVAAVFVNYALFFGKDFLRGRSAAKRKKAFVAETVKNEAFVRHTCAECGANEQSHPEIHFRYCSSCGKCFCEEHITQHKHE